MTPFELLAYAAASWYLAYALTQTHGPAGIFERLREWRGGRWHGRVTSPEFVVTTSANTSYETTEVKGGKVIHDGLLDCIICLMVWIAAALYLLHIDTLTNILAVAGVALFLHSYTGWRMKL